MVTLVVEAPVVKDVVSWFHAPFVLHVLGSVPPVPVAPR
jgi:hypothetical protein